MADISDDVTKINFTTYDPNASYILTSPVKKDDKGINVIELEIRQGDKFGRIPLNEEEFGLVLDLVLKSYRQLAKANAENKG